MEKLATETKMYHLANTDLDVSRLSYGTWHLGGTWDKNPLTEDLVDRADKLINTAFELGINHIDMADIYTMGKSDEVVGRVLKKNPGLRDKLVLQGKAGIILANQPNEGDPGRYDFSYDHIVSTVEGTLKRLGTDRLDLLALHRPDPLVEPEEIARALDHLYNSGKVRYFGVSNHNWAQIELLKKYVKQPLVLNQVELNLKHHHLISNGFLFNTGENDHTGAIGTLDYCRLHDITIQAWSPVAGGDLFKTDRGCARVKETIESLAKKHDTTSEAIAVSWLLRHPAGIQPIIGTLNEDRLKATAKADSVELSRKEWYQLLEDARGTKVP